MLLFRLGLVTFTATTLRINSSNCLVYLKKFLTQKLPSLCMSLHRYETAHESIKNYETSYRGISVQIVDRYKLFLSTLNGDISALLGLKSQLDEAGESQHG
jgi:hypothetical protein